MTLKHYLRAILSKAATRPLEVALAVATVVGVLGRC